MHGRTYVRTWQTFLETKVYCCKYVMCCLCDNIITSSLSSFLILDVPLFHSTFSPFWTFVTYFNPTLIYSWVCYICLQSPHSLITFSFSVTQPIMGSFQFFNASPLFLFSKNRKSHKTHSSTLICVFLVCFFNFPAWLFEIWFILDTFIYNMP